MLAAFPPRRSGQRTLQVALQESVAEAAVRIDAAGQLCEVGDARVHPADRLRIDREHLAPVRTRAEVPQSLLDGRQRGGDRALVLVPGEVDPDAVPTVGRAQPE